MKSRLIQWRENVSPVVKSVIAGDFCPREANSEDTAMRAEEIVAEVKPYFAEADLTFLQWECTVTSRETPIIKCGPNHRCFAPATAVAKALNVDGVLLANNHTGDYDDGGVEDTLNAFRSLQITTAGAGMDQAEAEKTVTFEKNGLKIALINAAEHEFGIARGERPGSAGLDLIRISTEIRARKQDHDIVLVALHGGHEHYAFPSPRLKKMCRFFADCGADAVFNCHSHCPVGFEVYNSVPIVYSPGNFYFPPRPTSCGAWFIGYIPKFHFDKEGAFALEILPYYNYKSRVALMNEEDTDRFFAYMDGLCAPIADDTLLQKYFDAWCVKDGLKGYLGILRAMPEGSDFTDIQGWMGVRNVLSCEAHHDLLRNCMYLVEQGRTEQAAEAVEEILRYQNPDWVKKEI